MITLVDYKAGNLTSVRRALDHLGIPCQISADPDVVRRAEKLIFPGVGAAGAAMAVLRERGLDAALKEAFKTGIPILGICIGCQIILTHSEEDDADGLDLLPGNTVRFRVDDPALKIPHMGWNGVTVTRPHPLLSHLRPGDEFYFVHSFYPQPADAAQIYAVSDYGGQFPVAIGKDNLFAVQFHAEKSGTVGLKVLENFRKW
ncbi:MAG: imidazole glycerol phosphate synthase subunit HisH [Chloroflexi bacterium]|nr:imidazole glycerol phosphate synthase subunit HisH [Chloroflexota bacterium]